MPLQSFCSSDPSSVQVNMYITYAMVLTRSHCTNPVGNSVVIIRQS